MNGRDDNSDLWSEESPTTDKIFHRAALQPSFNNRAASSVDIVAAAKLMPRLASHIYRAHN